MTRAEKKRIQKELFKIENRIVNQIGVNYSIALDNIRKEIVKLGEKYSVNGKLTYAEMSKYNRLVNLEKSIIAEMNDVYIKNGKLTGTLQGVQYAEAFYRNYYAINKIAGVDINFGLLSPEKIRAAIENPLEKIALQNIKINGIAGIRRTVTQGLIQGQSVPQMTKGIKKFLESDFSRAEKIVRTESARAQVIGSQNVYNDLQNKGIKIKITWLATLDDRTRPDHQQLDGKERNEDRKAWYVPGIGWVTGPCQSGVAEFDINCRCDELPEVINIPNKYRRIDKNVIEYKDYNTWAKSKGIKQYGIRTIRVKR